MQLSYNSGTLYKGLFIVICFLIIVEYFFASRTESRRWETLFLLNTTRIPVSQKPSLHQKLFSLPTSDVDNAAFAQGHNGTNSTKSYLTNALTSLRDEKQVVNNFSNSSYKGNSNAVTTSSRISSVPPLDVRNSRATEKTNATDLPLCPDPPPDLLGRIKVQTKNPPMPYELQKRFSWLKKGGHWSPDTCRAPKKVAIVVPFRCRGEHLLLFLQHMHPFLKRQLLDYTIFVVEQNGSEIFNRAMLMNIGFVEALKIDNFDCFIFHDVDLLPEDDRNLYTCPEEQPRHMSVAIDTFRYKLPYAGIFGGVGAISREHFIKLNGFSNSFWGWGGEDDDFSNRIRFHKLHISRYPLSIARYTMLSHKRDKPNPKRYEVLTSGMKKFDYDGLNSLKYKLLTVRQNILYTWILVDIKAPR